MLKYLKSIIHSAKLGWGGGYMTYHPQSKIGGYIPPPGFTLLLITQDDAAAAFPLGSGVKVDVKKKFGDRKIYDEIIKIFFLN